MSKGIFTFLLRFGRSTSGASALEFGLIVPILALVVVSLVDVTQIAMGASRMQSAVRSSLQYALNGGDNMTTARTLGESAWASRPSDSTLTVTKSCKCGSSAGACDTLCSDGNIPQIFITATAQGTLGGDVISISKTVTEVARLR